MQPIPFKCIWRGWGLCDSHTHIQMHQLFSEGPVNSRGCNFLRFSAGAESFLKMLFYFYFSMNSASNENVFNIIQALCLTQKIKKSLFFDLMFEKYVLLNS